MPPSSTSRCVLPSLPLVWCRDRSESTYPLVLNRKWESLVRILSLLAGCVAMSICGTLYGFGLYGDDLKTQIGYTQTEISLVSSFGDWGLYMGVFMGVVHDMFGPNTTALVGTALLFLGYFFMYLTSMRSVTVPAAVLGMFFFLVGQGSKAGYLSALVSNDTNWPARHRGKIVGSMVAFFGLSSGLLTLYHRFAPAFQSQNPQSLQNFLLFLTLYPSALLFLGALLITRIGFREEQPNHPLRDTELHEEQPFVSPSDQSGERDKATLEEANMKNDVEEEDNQSIRLVREDRSVRIEIHLNDALREDISPRRIIRDPRFYLFFFTAVFVTAPGLVYINNIPFFCRALHEEGSKDANVLVLSLSNTFGRILFGVLADVLIHRIPRIFWVIIGGIVMIVAQIVLLTTFSLNSIYIGSVIVGIAYGGIFATTPCLVREIFGARFFGTNLGFLNSAPGIGIAAFGVLTGALYDSETVPGEKYCYGARCFQLIFVILACISALGCILCYFLYRMDMKYLRKRRLDISPINS